MIERDYYASAHGLKPRPYTPPVAALSPAPCVLLLLARADLRLYTNHLTSKPPGKLNTTEAENINQRVSASQND